MNAATIKPSLLNLKKNPNLNTKAAKNRQKLRKKPKKKQLTKLSDKVLKSKIIQATQNPLENKSSMTNSTLSIITGLCKCF